MATTTQELVDIVMAHQFNTEKYTPWAIYWMNKAQKYIVRQSNVRVASKLTTSTLVVGQYDYTLPEDFARLINMAIYESSTTDATFLRHLDLEDYIIANKYIATPFRYTLNRENLFSLYPAPDRAYNLDFYYYKLPDDLSIEAPLVDPVLPEDYDDLLVNYAISKIYLMEHDQTYSKIHRDLFDADLMKLRGELQYEDDTGPQVVEGTWANIPE